MFPSQGWGSGSRYQTPCRPKTASARYLVRNTCLAHQWYNWSELEMRWRGTSCSEKLANILDSPRTRQRIRSAENDCFAVAKICSWHAPIGKEMIIFEYDFSEGKVFLRSRKYLCSRRLYSNRITSIVSFHVRAQQIRQIPKFATMSLCGHVPRKSTRAPCHSTAARRTEEFGNCRAH